MKQGFSGSTVRRIGNFVEKRTSDLAFTEDISRQADLVSLSGRLAFLAEIKRINGSLIKMKFIEGREGLTESSAFNAGQTLRELHDQSAYPHPCHTGIQWLMTLANDNLVRASCGKQISLNLAEHYPIDALIHSEPVQFIEKPDGEIVFIDIEGIGRGSRYQDLGFIYYITQLSGDNQIQESFMRGYSVKSIDLKSNRISQVAGLIAIAYASFADPRKRLRLGLYLLEEADRGQAPQSLRAISSG